MERDQATRFVHDLLRLLISKKGSDLFITADFPPAFKIDGRVLTVSNQPLTAQHTSELVRAIMNDRQAAEFEKSKECNFAINPTGIGRFRVSAFVQQSKVGIVFRTIADHIPTTDELNLPPLINELAMAKRGIVIVVGATGSGKSTTLAAMVGYRNENSNGHIITIEDPIEYVHPHKNCIITQREVGVDCDSWQVALKNTLRQAPDVILIAAREFHQPGARPHHQLLPRRAPPATPDGPVAQPARDDRPAPGAVQGPQGPDSGDRTDDQQPAHRGPGLQGRSAGDQGSDEAFA
jgi:twitching motility protein PilU